MGGVEGGDRGGVEGGGKGGVEGLGGMQVQHLQPLFAHTSPVAKSPSLGHSPRVPPLLLHHDGSLDQLSIPRAVHVA